MDSNHRPSPSQSDELTTALTRDGIYTKITKHIHPLTSLWMDNETFAGLFAIWLAIYLHSYKPPTDLYQYASMLHTSRSCQW